MTTLLITGATRGLGLAAAQAAAARGAHVLVAGRSPEVVRATATAVGGEPVVLDLERLAAVQAVAEALPAVDAVALNAGVQVVTGASRTPDGFETPSRSTTSRTSSSSTPSSLAPSRPRASSSSARAHTIPRGGPACRRR